MEERFHCGDLRNGEKLRVLQARTKPLDFAANVSDQGVIMGTDHTFLLTGQGLTQRFDGCPLAVSHDGRFVTTAPGGRGWSEKEGNDPNADNSVVLWDVERGTRLATLPGHGVTPCCADIASDGLRIVTGADDGSAILWDTSTSEPLRKLVGHSEKIGSVVFSPDETKILTGSTDKTAILWDAKTGKRIRTVDHSNYIYQVTFSPDDKSLITAGHGEVILWETATGRKLRVLDDTFHACVAFSPTGHQVVVGEWFGSVRLWDPTTGRKLRELKVPGKYHVHAVRFASEGRYVLAATGNGAVHIWDVATGDELVTVVVLEDGQDWLAVTPDGLFDGSSKARQSVMFRVGGGLDTVPVDRFFQDFYRPGLLSGIQHGERPIPTSQFGVKLAPRVRILSPKHGETVDAPQLTLQVEVTDQGGGVKGPWLVHNGARILAPGQPVTKGKTVKRSFTVAVVEGENQFRVFAASEDGSWESEPAAITLKYEQTIRKPELHLVAVGVNRYAEGSINLQFAAADAGAMASVFKTRGPALYGRTGVHVTTLLDDKATKQGIQDALSEVAKQAKPQDTFILFLAGHGTMVGQRYYFLPHEFQLGSRELEDAVRQQGLAGDELDDAVSAIPALKRVLIYDTCQSGGTVGVGRLARNPFGFAKAMEAMSRAQGAFVLAATAATDDAQEVPELGHGVLSYALLAALGAVDKGPLRQRTLKPSDAESVANVRGWFGFAQDEVPALTRVYFGQEQFVRFTGAGSDFPILPLEK